MDVYEFGPFRLDVERLLLLEHGEPVALGPKVVETLLALLEHPGEVLSKASLLDRIWPEGFVEEANLAQNIYVLRKTFRTHWETEAIETVPRRGYRFTAPVYRFERSSLVQAPMAQAPVAPIAAPPSLLRRLAAGPVAFALVAACIVLLAGYALARHEPSQPRLSDNGARLYQIGRYYWNQRTPDGVRRSLSYFAQVVDSDPKAPQGYAGLADANAVMGDYQYGSQKPAVYFARAHEYAQKALGLDPKSAEARGALGLIALDKEQLPLAQRELRKAIALDGSYGPAREWYGIALLSTGNIREGYQQLKMAADLDPLSVATTAWLGDAAYLDRHFTDAIAYSRQALELSPGRTDALMTIGEAYEADGNFSRAIETYCKLAATDPAHRAEASALLAHAYAGAHQMSQAREALRYARAHSASVMPSDLAAAEAALGDRDAAIAALRHVHQRTEWISISADPRFDRLRRDPAFIEIARESA